MEICFKNSSTKLSLIATIVFFFLYLAFFTATPRAFAGSIFSPSAPNPDRYEQCGPPSQCSIGTECNNGPSASNSGGCGTACGEGSAWTKYQCQGVYKDTEQQFGACDISWYQGGSFSPVCSTGDKYNSSTPPVMNWGSCSCEAGNGYKTCCNGTTPVGANSYSVDPYPPPEADCGSATTVYCGQPGQPLCGQAACNTLATPTPTPTPTPPPQCPGGLGSCSAGQAAICQTSNVRQTCEYNSSVGGYCWTTQPCQGQQTCSNGVCAAPTPTPTSCGPNKTFCGGICWNNSLCPFGFTNCDGAAQCVPGPTPTPTPTPTGSPTPTPTPTQPPLPPGCFIYHMCTDLITMFFVNLSPPVSISSTVCQPGYRCVQDSGVPSWPFCMTATCQYSGPLSIQGTVFKDVNSNGYKDAFEQPATESYNIDVTWAPGPSGPPSAPPALSIVKNGANYTVTGTTGNNSLPYGTYTVRITNLGGLQLTEPTSGNSFTVVAGRDNGQQSSTCNKGSSVNASCVGDGSIANLHFGVKTVDPWIQSIGADIRKDAGFSQQIPQNALCGSYASLPGGGGFPGIIYSGDSTSSFGTGQASAVNWVVGDPIYPETYTPTRPNLIRTSYNYLRSVSQQAGITPIDISPYCLGGISNCTLSSSLPNGLYISNGNLTLEGPAFTFPAGKNFVILVNGDLNIRTKILVPNGSTATFSSVGNITVDRSVGQSSFSSTASDIEGFYSTDRSFIVDGANNCSAATDLRLNIAGAVVVNAALGGGTFQNNRNLCEANASCPAFAVKERLDFVLNAPEFIKRPSYIWQESAP